MHVTLVSTSGATVFNINFNMVNHFIINKIISLIKAKYLQGQSALFADVHGRVQLPGHCLDIKLTEGRSHFLLKAVSAAMNSITVHNMVSLTIRLYDFRVILCRCY